MLCRRQPVATGRQSDAQWRPYTYEAHGIRYAGSDGRIALEKASLVGWSDGACVALVLGAKVQSASPAFLLCLQHGTERRKANRTWAASRSLFQPAHERLCSGYQPHRTKKFNTLVEALAPRHRERQPDYSAQDLAEINVPVAIVQGEHDDLITRDHTKYSRPKHPNAELLILKGVSHFAPLQRPGQFNHAKSSHSSTNAVVSNAG